MSEEKSKAELQQEYDAKFDELRDRFFDERKAILEKFPAWRGQDTPDGDRLQALTRRYYASIKALQQEYASLFRTV